MENQLEHTALDWAAVQRDYEASDGTLLQICERFGISEAQLRYRRERHGWKLRNDWSLRVQPLINRMIRVLDAQVRRWRKRCTSRSIKARPCWAP